jgi:hypothetical protein
MRFSLPFMQLFYPLLPSNSSIHYNVDMDETSTDDTDHRDNPVIFDLAYLSDFHPNHPLVGYINHSHYPLYHPPTPSSFMHPCRSDTETVDEFSGGAVKLGEHRELNSNHFLFYFLFSIFPFSFSFSFAISFLSAFPLHFHFRFQLNLNADCHWQCRFHFRHFNQL